MIRLFTWEALAHGAEVVSYFRWRQAPFAQEQMHSGLLRPDRSDDVGVGEVRQAGAEIAFLAEHTSEPVKQVALIFDYQSDWVTEILPQGHGFRALWQAFGYYSALRKLGLNIDILPPSADLSGYAMVVIPCMPIIPDGLVEKLKAYDGQIIIGPRSGSKTADFAIPVNLAPGVLQEIIPLKVTRVESLRPNLVELAGPANISLWLEHIESGLTPEIATDSGHGICYRDGSIRYVAGRAEEILLGNILKRASIEAGLPIMEQADGIRVRRNGDLLFVFNYNAAAETIDVPAEAEPVLGDANLPSAGVGVWRTD
jgi:beta-galactosidase